MAPAMPEIIQSMIGADKSLQMSAMSTIALGSALFLCAPVLAVAGDGYPTSERQGEYTDSGPTQSYAVPPREAYANGALGWDRQQRRRARAMEMDNSK
jgi:hypothetical protein